MSQRERFARWSILLLGLAAIGGYLVMSIDLELRGQDDRPAGGPADIEALSDRTDLNVLFVLIDTLRADRLSAYGYSRATSPFLERLASTGVIFVRNLAQSSWTKASMASLWTGLYPLRAGVTKFDHALAEEAVLPAEILRDNGYRTAGLYRNGWTSGYFGFGQGFDNYYKPTGPTLPQSLLAENPNLSLLGGSDTDVLDDAVEFLRIHGHERNWLLYLHLMDLHEYVYDVESAAFGTRSTDIYDNSILRVDSILESFYERLTALDLLESTIIVIASDHGEAFGERGFEGHAREVLPETTRTPLIISLPFRLEPGLTIGQRTRNVDIWPTLLDLLGLSPMEDIDGRSRVPEILAAARGIEVGHEEETAYAHLDEDWGRPSSASNHAVAVAEEGYQFVSGTDFSGQPFEALLEDRDGEQINVIGEHPEIAERLREMARSHVDTPVKWQAGTPTLEIDEMQLNQLRALGYRIP